jgi:hypothetical protein
VTSWGAPTRALTFTYDYLGRRVRKQASGPNNGDTYDHKYVYQGWALIVATWVVVQSYAYVRFREVPFVGWEFVLAAVGLLVFVSQKKAALQKQITAVISPKK